MIEHGTRPDGLEVGNAWQLHPLDQPQTNWIVGNSLCIPVESLRFMQQTNPGKNITGTIATDIAIKWFLHNPSDPAEWGVNKPTSVGRTLSILAGDGEFELVFTKDGGRYTLTLDTPGDFAIWGPGLQHSWRTLKTSTIITVRWKPQ